MGCLVFFNFLLLATAVTLLILGVTTTRWLVFTETNNINLRTERSIGIIYACQRLYYQNVTDLYSTISNFSSNSAYDDAYVCYNRLFKWYNASISGPELLDYQKTLIGISFGSAFASIVALFLTQLLKTNASFHNLRCSKRIIECLLMVDILTVVLALVTLALFLGFERLQTITAYGFSFWVFVAGTCCIFLSCVLTAVYRIDVEFEFRRYRHESVATLC